MKEVKVRLYCEENDSYVELWQVINPVKGKPQYYGRYTYMDEGTWYYVSDPLGYRELDHTVKDDIVFICCDINGNECVRYSNADKNPLPKFKTVMKEQWKSVSKNIVHNEEDTVKNFWAECWNGDTTMSINQWLLTFKDPDLYGQEIANMNGYDENWTGFCHTKEIGYEAIPETEFEYLGHKYQFTKVIKKHEVCGVEWNEFVCTDAPYIIGEEYGLHYYGYLGNWFDKTNVGTCLDKRTAREMVTKVLEEVYGCKNVIDFHSIYDIRTYSLSDAAERLLNGDLHKMHIEKVIETERKSKSFIPNTKEERDKIEKEHPDIPYHIWFNVCYGRF